ncbi:MAG: butyrate kinase [Candidatus Aminicenantes bacterium]|nr:butyrate kinase [Candidatus Aminicenantes bacterium]
MNAPILVINTGNTSTKIAIFDMENPVFIESIKHSDEELKSFENINDQIQFREKIVLDFLNNKGVNINDLKAISARGGLLKPLKSGTYIVNQAMLNDLVEGRRGLHASHLSAQIGFSIASKAGINCYIVDPISVDELCPLARYSGHPLFERIMLSHALNMKAVCKRYANETGVKYSDLNLIVIHLGTGISVSIHEKGIMIDGINSSEEGTFSPDRSGGLPILQVIKYVIDNKPEYKTFSKTLFGEGGLNSYLNTKDFMKIEEMYISGDRKTIEVVEAMAYQIAKDTGAMATIVNGKVDRILITGGMANAKFLVKLISDRISFIAPVKLYPGEDEMKSLAEGVARVLKEEETFRNY